MKLALLIVAAAVGCSLTHSLDDLKGGSSAAGSGGTGGAGGDAGGADLGGTAGSSGGSTEPEGGAAGAELPRLVQINAEEEGGLGFLEPLELTFSEAMDDTTVTTTTGSVACAGSIQLSDDPSFDTCVQMREAPTSSAPNVFTVTPLEPLTVGAKYYLKVTQTAKTAAAEALAPDQTREFTPLYRHTITLDGTNDFLENETFATSSPSYTGYVAWDRKYLYVGMQGLHIGGTDAGNWVQLYLGTDLAGGLASKTSVQYGDQALNLEFDASYHLRWKSDNNYMSLETFSGGAWSAGGGLLANSERSQKGEFVEMRVARSALGEPPTLRFLMFMLDEVDQQITYAAVPSQALNPPSGTSPSNVGHFQFDLSGLTVPADHPML